MLAAPLAPFVKGLEHVSYYPHCLVPLLNHKFLKKKELIILKPCILPLQLSALQDTEQTLIICQMTVLINEGPHTPPPRTKAHLHFPEQLGMRTKHGTHGRGLVRLRQEEKYQKTRVVKNSNNLEATLSSTFP